jgi:hypothetical protein
MNFPFLLKKPTAPLYLSGAYQFCHESANAHSTPTNQWRSQKLGLGCSWTFSC